MDDERRRAADPLEVAVVGLSLEATCGVRDHAELLARALAIERVSSTVHWLQRNERSLRGSSREIAAFAEGLSRALAERPPDAILLHYSVFTASHKGVPIFLGRLLAPLRASGIPVVGFLHEFAYPWGYGGWRGVIWSSTQRAGLIAVMRAIRATIVTAESRAQWLASRVWLPRRRVLAAPVFSNLPPPTGAATATGKPSRLGLFGYGYQGAATAIVLDALAELRAHGTDVALRMLGAPGASSPAGEGWIAEARERGVADLLSFSGPLPAQELSDALAACDVLLFADSAGPSPRKGTLAGSLASGRPVVAIDGPATWPELAAAGAISLVQPQPGALAQAVAGLLSDRAARDALGVRGRAFAEQQMGLARTSALTRQLIDETLGVRRS